MLILLFNLFRGIGTDNLFVFNQKVIDSKIDHWKIFLPVVLGGIYTINSEYALVIKSVEKEDQGTYVCRAQNSEGFGQDSIPIGVEIKGMNSIFRSGILREKVILSSEPIKFISKPDSIYHVHEKDRLILPCVVSARPQASIKWFKV